MLDLFQIMQIREPQTVSLDLFQVTQSTAHKSYHRIFSRLRKSANHKRYHWIHSKLRNPRITNGITGSIPNYAIRESQIVSPDLFQITQIRESQTVSPDPFQITQFTNHKIVSPDLFQITQSTIHFPGSQFRISPKKSLHLYAFERASLAPHSFWYVFFTLILYIRS
ncbi:hypothetical protein SAMN05661012_01147 [Chitinophaga sancti]|uniref:Uncharacterized protein n=1 Tax=Chitinophaga sancti TaxID=1004 RepID=A0A1K1NB53_9BACT|nr:hypothetical protein SAMN05661012_01147 [Chitinophaga sancti]